MSTQRKHWKVDGPSHLKKAFIEDLKERGMKPLGTATDDLIIEGKSIYYCNSNKWYRARGDGEDQTLTIFALPEQYNEALKYITGTVEACRSEKSDEKKQFKNSDWSVEGSYGLIKAFKEKLEEVGYIYPDSIFESEYKKGNMFIVPSDSQRCPRIIMFDQKEKNHFKLPDQWDEALKYATETVDDQEEIQEGDWVWIKDRDFFFDSNMLVCFKQEGHSTYGFDFTGGWSSSISLPIKNGRRIINRKATKSEVEDKLWKEWERRCKEAGVKNPTNAKLEHFPNDLETEALNSYQAQYEYIHSKAKMYNNNGLIFEKGHWATPKPSLPEIEISGYKAEYREDSVKFGCVSVEADTIKELDRIQRESGKEIFIRVGGSLSNEGIHPEELKQIAEHYSRK